MVAFRFCGAIANGQVAFRVRRRPPHATVFLVAVGMWWAAGAAPARAAVAADDTTRAELIARRDRALAADGYAEAVRICESLLAHDHTRYGEISTEVVEDLGNLFFLRQLDGDLGGARETARRMQAVEKQLPAAAPGDLEVTAAAVRNIEAISAKPEEARRKYVEADRKYLLAERLIHNDKMPEAATALEAALKLAGESLEPTCLSAAQINLLLADVYSALGDGAASYRACLQANLAFNAQGCTHAHDYGAVRLRLSEFYRRQAEIYLDGGPDLKREAFGFYCEAVRLNRQAAEILQVEKSPTDIEALRCVNDMLYLARRADDWPHCAELSEKSLAIARALYGPESPNELYPLQVRLEVFSLQGDSAQATEAARRRLRVYEHNGVTSGPQWVQAKLDLARVVSTQMNWTEAQYHYQAAVDALTESKDADPKMMYEAVRGLETTLVAVGRVNEARRVASEALDAARQRHGPDHPLIALYLLLPSLTDSESALLDNAEAADAILKKHDLSDLDRHVAWAYGMGKGQLENVAVSRAILQERPDDALMEQLNRRAVKEKSTYGARAQFATVMALALAHMKREEYQEAYDWQRKSDEIIRSSWSDDYLQGLSRKNLATAAARTGRSAEAWDLYREGFGLLRGALHRAALGRAERDQIQALQDLRSGGQTFLADALHYGWPLEQIWLELAESKGGALKEQLVLSRLKQNPVHRETVEQLTRTAAQLAALSQTHGVTNDPAKWQRDMDALTAAMEDAQRGLAQRSGEYRTSLAPLTLDAVRRSLPPDGVLIDVYSFFASRAGWPTQQERLDAEELAAFIIARDRPVAVVRFGPSRHLADQIAEWRAHQAPSASATTHPSEDELRKLVWEPLRDHVAGARLLLVSPDGPLAQFPLAALRIGDGKKYLIEDYAVVKLVAPRLLAASSNTATESPMNDLLLVGDVDFGATGPATLQSDVRFRPGLKQPVQPLFNSMAEILSIEVLFRTRREQASASRTPGDVTRLTRNEATEQAFRQRVGNVRYVHLATHGFFASPDMPSAVRRIDGARMLLSPKSAQKVAGWHPGLLSGVVFAGVNLPVLPDADDGILTALEAATLDMSGVDLAVLSACDTGLGPIAGGEGTLSLARAFHAAGARSVIAGLWRVDDAKTQELMIRFYKNLWEKKLPKYAALREAQLEMLLQPAGRFLAPLKPSDAAIQKSPPFFWAPFELSGDWH